MKKWNDLGGFSPLFSERPTWSNGNRFNWLNMTEIFFALPSRMFRRHENAMGSLPFFYGTKFCTVGNTRGALPWRIFCGKTAGKRVFLYLMPIRDHTEKWLIDSWTYRDVQAQHHLVGGFKPIWKICGSQIGSFPQGSGWTKNKIFETTTQPW